MQMNLSSLINKIIKLLAFHNSRAETFKTFVLSMIDQRKVQHPAMIHKMHSPPSIKSKLERVRRFFKGQVIDSGLFSKALISSILEQVPKMRLMLDGTNWKFGTQNINYLVLAVRVGKITFPLFWSMLDHQENSHTQARISLLNQF
ncbi:hypothetical protein HE1_00664 [Holospora elegans E1]|uniref:Transposase n=1 Tax=Holospora elegans E1 TaxID=1427503 RepID=A0A023DY00_9PROT|nr:hypothetical protein [Holospora elegans]GAJ46333.1 hypothetical protein HE1_00664 [Holospora elegans E1]